MMDFGWAWLAPVVICLLCSLGRWLVSQRRKCFEAFEGTGIPTVPLRSLIKGNMDEYWNPTCIQSLSRWHKEYGDVFGFFLGDTPFVVTKDVKMINEIFIKDFSNFHIRGHQINISEWDTFFGNLVAFAKGAIWKTCRNCMAQFFTPSKLKAVLPSLLHAQLEFIEILGERADQDSETEINTLCERFTFDVISKVAYGIDTNVQRHPENPLFKTALAVLPSVNRGFFYELGQSLYHWSWLLKVPVKLMKYIVSNPLNDFNRKAEDVIQYRRMNPEVRLPDMAQILLDGLGGKDDSDTKREEKNGHSLGKIPKDVMNLLAPNCMAIFLAGYDTTRLAMTYWFFLMGKYQKIQERMRNEAMEAFKKEGRNLSYQTLTTLPYTNQVIAETLRIYPPVITLTTRCADEDYRYGPYLIRKGMSVMVPTYQLHHDPLHWAEPDKFDPERFSPENKALVDPTAYQPFGIGPRICLGQRLAIVELASVTTEVLRHFWIRLAPSQKADLELDTYSFMAVPKESVRVQLHKLRVNE